MHPDEHRAAPAAAGAAASPTLSPALNAAPLGLGFLDHELRFVELNAALAKVFGQAPEACAGKLPAAFLRPEQAAEFEAQVRTVLQGATIRHELAIGHTWWEFTAYPVPAAGSGATATIGLIANEITGRKQLESDLATANKARLEKDRRLGALADSMPCMLVETDAEGTPLFTNSQWEKYTGAGVAKSQSEGWSTVIHPDDLAALANQPGWTEGEMRILRRDGEYRWHLVSRAALRDAAGAISRWVNTATDIHDRKLAEEQLRESEERFRGFANALPVLAWITDPNGSTTFSNQCLLNLTGLEPEEMAAGLWANSIHPDDRPHALATLSEALRSRKGYTTELRLADRNGAYRWHHLEAVPQFDAHGNFRNFVGSGVDIHETREAEAAHLRRAQQLAHLAEAASAFTAAERLPDLVRLISEHTLTLVDADRVKTTLTTGRSRDGTVTETALAENAPSRASVPSHNVPLVNSEGERIGEIMLSGRFDALDEAFAEQIARLATAALEKALLRQELADHNAHLETLIEQIPAGVFVLNADGTVNHYNTLYSEVWGRDLPAPGDRVSRESVPVARYSDGAPIAPGEWPVLRAVRGETLRDVRLDIETPSGLRTLQVNAAPVRNRQGAIIAGIVAVNDITSQQAAENERERLLKELAAERARLQAVFDQMPSGIIIADAPDGAQMSANPVAKEMLDDLDSIGLEELRRRIAGFRLDGESIHPEDWPLQRVLRTNAIIRGEVFEIVYPDGRRIYLSANAGPVRDADGNLIAACVSLTDITEEREAREALRLSEARYRSVLEALPAMVWTVSPEGITGYANQRWRVALGLADADAPPVDLLRQVHPDDVPGAAEHLSEAMAANRPWELELRWAMPGGNYRWILSRSVPLRDANGKVIEWIGASIDIHDRKRAEERLRDALAHIGAVYENAPIGIALLDTEGKFLQANRALLIMGGDGHTEAEGLPVREVLPTMGAQLEEAARTVITTGEPLDNVEFSGETPSRPGAIRHWLASFYPVRSNDELLGVGAAIIDITPRKETEDRLAVSEERYRTVSEAIPQIAWSSTPEGRAIYFNTRWYEYTGLRREQMRNDGPRDWTRVIHPDDAAESQERWAHSIATGEPYEVEYRLRRYDGEYHWHLARALAVRDERGRLREWVGSITDIHDQKLAAEREQLLAEVGRQLAMSLDMGETLERVVACAVPNLGDVCLVDIIDEQGSVERVAASVANTSTANLTELAMEFLPHTSTASPVGRVLQTGKPEVRFAPATSDDAIDESDPEDLLHEAHLTGYMAVPMRAHGRTLGAITFVGLQGQAPVFGPHAVSLAEDVADRAAMAVANARLFEQSERTSAALRQSEERYRTLVEAIPAKVSLIDGTGRVTYRNAVLREYYGVENGPPGPTPWQVNVHPDDTDTLSNAWDDTVATGATRTFEVRLRNAAGEYRWHLAQTALLPETDGAIADTLLVAVDIEESKQAQAALERANALKDEFLGLVSHELRTPLTGILGHARVLVRSDELDPDLRRRSLEDIRNDAERLQRLVENMLVLAGIEGREHVATEPVLAQRIIRKVVEGYTTRQPGREINLHLPPTLPPVSAEPTYFEQVLTNLIGNAAKYSPPGQPIEVSASEVPGAIQVRVRDHGAGIPEGEFESIFKPFYRSPRTAAEAQGAGLGLAVCQRLLQAQGGRIWARNHPEGGAEFGFELPKEA